MGRLGLTMDKRVHNLKLYNKELKLQFLDNYDDESQLTYAYIISKATPTEEHFQKDLCQFDDKEIAYVLHEISPLNVSSSLRYGGVIKNYIDFGISKGYRKGNINPLTGLTKEWYKQFVGNKKIFITEDELIDMEDSLVNYQDKLPLRLAFEGILGEGMEEQITLTKKSIIDDNTLEVHEIDGEPRTVDVSDRCINFINAANNERTIYLKNGQAMGKKKEDELPTNKYVLRAPLKTESDPNAPISKFVLFRRLREAKEIAELPRLTYNILRQSGMIKYGVDLYHERGKLDREEMEIIQKKYDIGYLYGVQSIVTKENILNLYGIGISE